MNSMNWFHYQWKAMLNMGKPLLVALWKAGRAEFFSMFTLMAGMGFVMRYVTPVVVEGMPPDPGEAAFWGFAIAMFALLVGTVVTYPMNWWLIFRGWKHGMA